MIRTDEAFKTMAVADGLKQGPPYALVWKVPGNLPYFDGHFPGMPIFPAVGIVDASVHFLKAVLARPDLYVPHFPVAKFMSPIAPEQTVWIVLSPLSEKEWLVEWKDESSSKLLATLRVQL